MSDQVLPPISDRRSNPFSTWPRPVAYVLSGGGAFGPVQVGMLRALHEWGVTPDLVVGTSVGALNGAFLAAGHRRSPAAEPAGSTSTETGPEPAFHPGRRAEVDLGPTIEALAELWASMNRRSAFTRRRAVAYNLVRRGSLAGFDRLGSIIDDHIGLERFGDLALPFAAVATDALTGEPELMSAGELRPALLASAAVPGLFPVAMVDGRPFIDGGVSANLPIRQAIAFGARSIIAMDATQAVLSHRPPRTVLGGLTRSAALMVRNQRSHAIDELAHRYPIASMPCVTPPDLGTFDFSRTDELLEAGYRNSTEMLAAWSDQAPTSPAGHEVEHVGH